MKAEDVMTREVISIDPDSTVLQAARLMLQHHISGLPVICSRLFRFGSIYVNRKSGIKTVQDLAGKKVLILSGDHDPIARESGKKLKAALEKRSAFVTAIAFPAGHEITADDIALASDWITEDSDCKTPAECSLAV